MPKPEGKRPEPKVHVGDRLISIGAYGLFVSKLTDFWKIAKDTYESNFTGCMFHIMSPWCQVPGDPRFPWPFNKITKKFNLAEDNSEYYDAFQDLLDAFEWYGLDLLVNFDDQYFTAKWVAMTRAKLHPYQQNIFGVKLNEEKYVYDSVELPGGKFDWISWQIVNEVLNQFKFKLVDPFGEPRARWFSRIMDQIQAKRKECRLLFGPKGNPVGQNPGAKTWRVFLRRANEEFGDVDPETHETSHATSLGDRSEIYAWMHDMMVAKDLRPNGKNIFAVVNRDIHADLDADKYRHYTVLNRDIGNPFGTKFGMGALHEVHIDGVSDRAALLAQSQFRTNRTLWSTDGMPKHSAAQFTADNRKMYLCKDPWLDIIYEEGGIPGKPNMWGPNVKVGFPHDTQRNWDAVFKYHKAIVK